MKKMCMLLIAAAVLCLSGCQALQGAKEKLEISAYEKIQQTLISMETYQANATVKYVSNKGSNEYNTLQQCKSSGEYRVTVTGPESVAGNVTIFDGKIIMQFNPKISGKISVGTKESQERSEIFVTSFMKNYVSSQEVSVTAAIMDQSKCTVLEASVPGGHPYLASEKLWVDNESLKPVQLIIYDKSGGERIVVTYTDFEYNVKLEDLIFKAQ